MLFLVKPTNVHLVCLTLILTQNLHKICAESPARDLATGITNSITRTSRAASQDPDRKIDNYVNLSPPEIIEADGYPAETHTVTTEDGYILTLFRIPGEPGSTAVVLQHGLLESSVDWVIPGKGKSLAYILADNGYDVWLANVRGNTYSKKHETLSTSDRRFWDFTWEEQGRYDLAAFIDYISAISGGQIFYIGHSMGATTFTTLAIERPEITSKIKAAILLAPANYVYHMKSPIKFLALFWRQFQPIANALGINEVLPRSLLLDLFTKYVCDSALLRGPICGNLLFIIGGYSPAQLDYSLLPLIWSKFPAGTSVKLVVHWLQQINVNKYRRFDYGLEKNLKVYNASEPPNYDLTKVQIPVAAFWAENDALVGPEDVYHFYNQLPYKLGIYKVETRFNHFNFVNSKDGPELVYNNVLRIMSNFDNQIPKLQYI